MSDNKTVFFLLVDDQPMMRKILKNILVNAGFLNFLEADNGEKGYEILMNNPSINFIISDWNMPKKNGIEFLTMVRAHEKYKQLPFIFITAENEKEKVVGALAQNVTGYILKPFDAKTIREKIKKVLG